MTGVLSVAALPAAITAARETRRLELLDAAYAIPAAAFFGLLAVLLARGARRVTARTIGRVGGERSTRFGRALGVLGLCAATSATIALVVFEALVRSQ